MSTSEPVHCRRGKKPMQAEMLTLVRNQVPSAAKFTGPRRYMNKKGNFNTQVCKSI